MKKMVSLIAASFVVPFVLSAACPLCLNDGHNQNQILYPQIRPTEFHPSKRISKRSLSYQEGSNTQTSNRFYSSNKSASNQQARLHQNQQGKFLSDDDEDILMEVREILGDSTLTQNGRDMQVEVINGQVTIRGGVLSETEKQDIQSEIQNIDGVGEVILNLHIQNLSNEGQTSLRGRNTYYYQTSLNNHNEANQNASALNGNGNSDDQKVFSDEELKDRIEKKLHRSWFSKNFNNVRVKVINGEITLRGTVDSRDDLNDLLKRINTIPGISDIDNQISIKDDLRENQKTSYYYRPFF